MAGPELPFKHPDQVEREKRREDSAWLLAAAVVGAFIAFSLGVYGAVHEPGTDLAITLGFETTISMKVWLATGGLAFALFQLFSALWMFGKLPFGEAPAALGTLHRISGRLAFILTLPVAYHCVYQLGFQDTSTRALLHSIFGCAFYGAFGVKVVSVRSHNLPGWALPIAGGVLFALLVLAWWTSALWFIRKDGFPAI